MQFFKTLDFYLKLFAVLLVLSFILILFEVTYLDVFPQRILIASAFILFIITASLLVFSLHAAHKKISQIISLVLMILVFIVYSVGSFYFYKTYSVLDRITAERKENSNVISVISLKEKEYEDLNSLKGKTVAILKNIDAEGTARSVQNQMEQFNVSSPEDLPYELVEVDSVPQEITMLYEGDVDAIVFNEAYRTNIQGFDEYIDFTSRTQVLFQTAFATETSNEPLAVSDITTKPFNILISGNDTYGSIGELSRSDVNMVVTVNPITSTVLLTSIPRDSYVVFDCLGESSCAEGQMDKITHSGIYGISVTKATVQNLLGITCNYTFRVNFSSVVDIVNALGGIDVEIPEGMAVESFYADLSLEGVTEGWNHLDGERALAFARERYAYVDGDNQRVKNQQTVLEAIFAKATEPEIIVNYSSLLDTFENAFETNLTRDEITDFIKYQIQAMPGWTFETYQLTGEGAMLYCPSLGQEAYATVLSEASVQVAHDKIEAVLNGESANSIDESLYGIYQEPYVEGSDPVYYYEPEYYYDEEEYYPTDDVEEYSESEQEFE